jgi:hypothetical protein
MYRQVLFLIIFFEDSEKLGVNGKYASQLPSMLGATESKVLNEYVGK